VDAAEQVRRLWRHGAWADAALLAALRDVAHTPDVAPAWREYAHVLGAQEVWLSRLEQRPARAAVWPTLTPAEAEALAEELQAGYAAYVAALDGPALDRLVPYTNSAGQSFVTAAGDIQLHAAHHGQYHRGKVNVLLRQAGLEPVPTDYIAYVRGAPAATTRP